MNDSLDDQAARIAAAQARAAPNILPPEDSARRAGKAGLEFFGAVLLCFLAGSWLDDHVTPAPAGVLGGLLLGLAAGCYNAWRRFSGYSDKIGLNQSLNKHSAELKDSEK